MQNGAIVYFSTLETVLKNFVGCSANTCYIFRLFK